MAAGGNHNLALKNSAFDPNGWIQDQQRRWVHSLALNGVGTVFAWGQNTAGHNRVPGGLSGVIAVATGGGGGAVSGDGHSLALKSDGTVVAWGRNDEGQTNVPTGLSGVIAIGGGGFHSLAVKP